jgi:hypothetical protein
MFSPPGAQATGTISPVEVFDRQHGDVLQGTAAFQIPEAPMMEPRVRPNGVNPFDVGTSHFDGSVAHSQPVPLKVGNWPTGCR